MAGENFSTGAFYNITKNQDNPIKPVGLDKFLLKNHVEWSAVSEILEL